MLYCMRQYKLILIIYLLVVANICDASDVRWTTSYTPIRSGMPEVKFHIQDTHWVNPKIKELVWSDFGFYVTFDSYLIKEIGDAYDVATCLNGTQVQLQFATMSGIGDRATVAVFGGCDYFEYNKRISPAKTYAMRVSFKPAMETDFNLSSQLLYVTADSDGSWKTKQINMQGKNIAYIDVTPTGGDINLLSDDVILNMKSGRTVRIQGPASRAGYNVSATAAIKFTGTATTIGTSRYNINFSVTYV